MKKSAAKTIATATLQPAAPIQTTAFPPKQKQQTTREAIAANVELLIEQLEAGHSEGLTAYLIAMGRFRNYSFGNILEIARQKPSATRVAGLYAWNQLGRRVKKGERGIRILAPMIGVGRKKDTEAEKGIRTQNQPVLVGFRSAYVFDVAQTEGAELPELASKVSGRLKASLSTARTVTISPSGRRRRRSGDRLPTGSHGCSSFCVLWTSRSGGSRPRLSARRSLWPRFPRSPSRSSTRREAMAASL